jgi:hypothetical protein
MQTIGTKTKRRDRGMLEQLRGLNLERLDIDDAVALYTFGKQLSSTYLQFSMEVPEWVVDNTGALEKEIKNRRRDFLESERKKTVMAIESLKTKEERKTDLQQKLERLNQLLT